MREIPATGATERDRDFAIIQLIRGRSNAVGSVTLAANAASTTVTRDNMNENAAVFLVPRTANASAEIGAGTAYVSAITSADFTITHANNAQTDRTFDYVVIGG